MELKTGRFGSMIVTESEIISIPLGVLGFPQCTRYTLIDPSDETLILWLQSIDEPGLAFPVLEPKIFKADYRIQLSGADQRELKMDSLKQAAVFSILTIPDDVSAMTANLKAPLIINLKDKLAKQVVLQENEYQIKHAMFKELRLHLVTLQSQKLRAAALANEQSRTAALSVSSLPPSNLIKVMDV